MSRRQPHLSLNQREFVEFEDHDGDILAIQAFGEFGCTILPPNLGIWVYQGKTQAMVALDLNDVVQLRDWLNDFLQRNET